jgi:hypothetical protein
MRIEGEISVHRRAPDPDPIAEPGPEQGEEADAEPEEEPERPQPEPERDPRLWSKPRASSSPPPGSLRVTPWPSLT